MTLTQTCDHGGQSRAYEDAMGDQSGRCWREACRQSRQAERARLITERERLVRPVYSVHGVITRAEAERIEAIERQLRQMDDTERGR